MLRKGRFSSCYSEVSGFSECPATRPDCFHRRSGKSPGCRAECITILSTASVSPVHINGVRGQRSHLWKGIPSTVNKTSNSLGAVNRKKMIENHPMSCVLLGNHDYGPYFHWKSKQDQDNNLIELKQRQAAMGQYDNRRKPAGVGERCKWLLLLQTGFVRQKSRRDTYVATLIYIPPTFSGTSGPLSLLEIHCSSHRKMVVTRSLLGTQFLANRRASLLGLLCQSLPQEAFRLFESVEEIAWWRYPSKERESMPEG